MVKVTPERGVYILSSVTRERSYMMDGSGSTWGIGGDLRIQAGRLWPERRTEGPEGSSDSQSFGMQHDMGDLALIRD